MTIARPNVILSVLALALFVSLASLPTANNTTAQVPNPPKAEPSGVIYFPQDQVAAGFSKNNILYDGVPDHNYRVAVYHRDIGGEVEIHKKDTDVFYVLEGSATFVTGGALTSGKDTVPDEVRGPTMAGGVSRTISKGDVIIIPANVTHWFKEIQKPITYFGVKVR
jgi:quercetin dioxygenase-like cupin family protein